MNSLNRDQWKEVDERFDKEFTCIVTYEKWPDEEEQILREPQYKFNDFPNTNPKIIKNFLHSELEKVRQETIKVCVNKIDWILTPHGYESDSPEFEEFALKLKEKYRKEIIETLSTINNKK